MPFSISQILSDGHLSDQTSDDLYTLIEVIDPYTNVQFSDGSAASESSTNAEQHFYWTGASDDVLINVETNFPNAIGLASPQAWVLGRVAVDPYQNPDGSGNSTTPYQQANNDPATSLNQALSRNDEFALTVAYESDGGMSCRFQRSRRRLMTPPPSLANSPML